MSLEEGLLLKTRSFSLNYAIHKRKQLLLILVYRAVSLSMGASKSTFQLLLGVCFLYDLYLNSLSYECCFMHRKCPYGEKFEPLKGKLSLCKIRLNQIKPYIWWCQQHNTNYAKFIRIFNKLKKKNCLRVLWLSYHVLQWWP